VKLKLAEGLSLPLDTVTEKLCWLGRTGSGKTYGAMKLAELMLEAGAQVGALDPVGVWRALRVPAVKDGLSFEVVVFGGLYGDVPLEPEAGELIADLVVDRGLSFVLDVSQFIPSEQQRFVRAFADRFFHRKKAAPSAVHLFLEECQEFIPENPSGEEAKTLGVMQRLWKLGRNFGIGGSLISQRPQEISKKALNMSGTMFAFQMTGPQERKTVRAWVADHGVATDIESVLQTLATGEPHVESPTFLEVSKTVRILPRVTADLSSTPKVGASTAAKRPLTPIDVEQLKTSMAATIEKAKAEDPRELRKQLAEKTKRIIELERATSSLATSNEKAKPEVAPKRVQVLTDADRKLLERITTALVDLTRQIPVRWDEMVADIQKAFDGALAARQKDVLSAIESRGFQNILDKLAAVTAQPVASHPQSSRPTLKPPREWPKPDEVAPRRSFDPPSRHPHTPASGNGSVKGAEKRILNALAELEALGVKEPERVQVAFFAGYTHLNSKGLVNALGALRSTGFIDYPTQGRVVMTDTGQAHAKAVDVPRTPDEMRERVVRMLGGASARILEPLIDAYPRSMAREDVAAAAHYGHLNSKGFVNALGRLRSLGFIDYPSQGQVAAQPVLFLE
jgi:tRNA A37 N6-isopentenylltransferase MiaA